MRRNLQIVLFSVILLGLGSCQKPDIDIFYNKKYVKEIKKARKETALFMARNFVPGTSVAVCKNGELIYSEGIGLASKDLEVRADRSTKFRIGTMSAIYTNLIYQRMIEDGILHPDSSVQHYYPEFPVKTHKITLNNLAQETSGLRQPTSKEENWRALNVSLEKGIEQFKDDALASAPNLYQHPSTFNYNLLGVVMEKASKKHFRELLKEYLTDTLHLENTVIENPFSTIKGRTNYFDHNFISQVINAPFIDLRHKAPAAGLLSNAEDLAKLGNAVLHSDYFGGAIKERLFQPESLYNNIKSRMANGWMLLQDRKGRTLYGKEGTVTGGSSAILIYPEEDLVVAYTSNLSTSIDDSPIFDLAGAFLPQEEEAEKK